MYFCSFFVFLYLIIVLFQQSVAFFTYTNNADFSHIQYISTFIRQSVISMILQRLSMLLQRVFRQLYFSEFSFGSQGVKRGAIVHLVSRGGDYSFHFHKVSNGGGLFIQFLFVSNLQGLQGFKVSSGGRGNSSQGLQNHLVTNCSPNSSFDQLPPEFNM